MMADLFVVEDEILDALRNPDTTMASIEVRFHLENSLLHEALIMQNQSIISALEESPRFDFNARNVMGETIVHTIAKLGNARCLAKLIEWAEQGRINVQALTDTHRNFLHYIPHITAPALLKSYFSLATPGLVTAADQLGSSPLQLAIAQDNANFLEQVVLCFPELIALEKYGDGCRMHLPYLLHDIAKAGAVNCFTFLRTQFDDKHWFELEQYRNQTEELPIDTAVLAGKTTLLQMFKGYRNAAGIPSLQWAAVQASTSHEEINTNLLPCFLHEMFHDAISEKAFEAQKHWDETHFTIDPDDCILENPDIDEELDLDKTIVAPLSKLKLT